jgi:hypothetical protein
MLARGPESVVVIELEAEEVAAHEDRDRNGGGGQPGCATFDDLPPSNRSG